MRTITYKTVKVMRTIAATLILLVALSGVSKGENSGRELCGENNELSVQVKAWVGSNAYWSDLNNQDGELAQQIKSWMGKTTFWSQDDEENNEELALQLKTWTSNSSFWSAESCNNDQELAGQIKLWMNNNSYVDESNEQFSLGKELANN